MSDDQNPNPVPLEDALMGITLLESLVDAEKEELFEQLTDDLDTMEIFKIYSQLCMLWLMTEAESNGQSYPEYVRALRKRMIDAVFERENGRP